jgi:hypothetical protein
MAEEDHGAGVAEDFRYALEDLTMNLRVEIVTLTNVAKESITHAFAIAEVLKEHIKKVCSFLELQAARSSRMARNALSSRSHVLSSIYCSQLTIG